MTRSELVIDDAQIEVRDESERVIDLRIVPWDTVAETSQGLEYLERGAFEGVDPASVVLRLEHENPAAGVGLSFDDRPDGAYMSFRVARTARGDEILELGRERVTRGASVGFEWLDGGHRTVTRGGRRVTAHRRANLREVSTTWRPAYTDAAVLAVRSDEQEGTEPMTDSIEAEAAIPAAPPAIPAAVLDAPAAAESVTVSRLVDRLDRLEERARQDTAVRDLVSGPALSHAIERRVLADRALADVLTTDNEGVVPDAFTSEMIGIIDPSRPFMQTTRRLPFPAQGTRLIVPVIEQRPLVGKQDPEKEEVASRKTIISSTDFAMQTFAGAGDLSVQLIRQSSPEFLNLWLELLGEAYADVTENAAVDSLLAAAGVNAGAADFDPITGDVSFGEAYVNAQAVSTRLFPDTLWLSTAAMAAFIDAKTDGTNQPLYTGLSLNVNAAGTIDGQISGLRAVHVPALNDEAVDAIVGPSRGFAWSESGVFSLQADVPSKAGRDVGLYGFVYLAPWYPEAFTTYALAS